MNVKALIAQACYFGRRCVQAYPASRGKRLAIWGLVLVVGLGGLSGCATLGKQISYGGRGKIDLTENGVTSAELSLEFGLDSSKSSTPAAARSAQSYSR